MNTFVCLHVSDMGHDVVSVVFAVNMTGAEVAALVNVNPVFFGYAGRVFNKQTGINLEA